MRKPTEEGVQPQVWKRGKSRERVMGTGESCRLGRGPEDGSCGQKRKLWPARKKPGECSDLPLLLPAPSLAESNKKPEDKGK